MHNVGKVWLVGCLATSATAASTVFNGILAVTNTSNDHLALGLRILLFVGLGFSFLGFLSLTYFTTGYVRNIKSHSLQRKTSVWSVLGCGIGVGLLSVALPLVPLVWLTVVQQQLSQQILDQAPIVWIAAWFGCWGLAVLLQLILFVILALWSKKRMHNEPVGRLDIDSGDRLPLPPMREIVPDDHRSFTSRDTTIGELPRTPSTKRPVSSQYSVSIKASSFVGPAPISRPRIASVGRSTHSSIDIPFPAGEAQSVDDAFDRWDTSTVHSEMRAAVGSSPVVRPGLETIPGSRPGSPEDVMDGSILPSSPQASSSSPQAITADKATVLGDWSSSPSRYIQNSSPPSSPPNFSRPTSKQKNQPLTASFETSMQEIIHPLFRSSSPHPPPIAIPGTMVTASPMANQPITPRTLANLRNHSKTSSGVIAPKSTGHWRAMPSISQTSERRPSTSGSQVAGTPAPGSPGPSIVDEDELPPILPGFVLSAGQRTSMLGYANRKSLKRDRRGSQMSNGV